MQRVLNHLEEVGEDVLPRKSFNADT